MVPIRPSTPSASPSRCSWLSRTGQSHFGWLEARRAWSGILIRARGLDRMIGPFDLDSSVWSSEDPARKALVQR
ncbi:g2628 [Coccomyxa viridis]|uniref:G2628 protein n=1 Tax=Coccomyxa viridis TaxID=1274662 RepID=A0ABP1FR20_9CHLO